MAQIFIDPMFLIVAKTTSGKIPNFHRFIWKEKMPSPLNDFLSCNAPETAETYR